MKLAIVGTRNPRVSFEQFTEMIDDVITPEIDTIISGGAKGIDTYAKKYAGIKSLNFVEIYPQYKKYGRNATLMRNSEIVKMADRMFAFPSVESKGTYDSIRKMKKANKNIKIYKI